MFDIIPAAKGLLGHVSLRMLCILLHWNLGERVEIIIVMPDTIQTIKNKLTLTKYKKLAIKMICQSVISSSVISIS